MILDYFTTFTWSLTASTIFATYLNAKQNKYGFLIWGFCNVLWLGVDVTRGIYAQAALYLVFIGFNIYGWCQWKKKDVIVGLQDVIYSQPPVKETILCNAKPLQEIEFDNYLHDLKKIKEDVEACKAEEKKRAIVMEWELLSKKQKKEYFDNGFLSLFVSEFKPLTKDQKKQNLDRLRIIRKG